MGGTATITAFKKLPYKRPISQGVGYKYRVTITLQADAADASLAVTLTAAQMEQLDGLFVYKVIVRPGATAPTDASDLAIEDSRGLVLMDATRNGLNLVDATSTLWNYTDGPTSGNHYHLLEEEFPVTITVTGNSVNSAIVILDLELTE
jgi:hypothetical protein